MLGSRSGSITSMSRLPGLMNGTTFGRVFVGVPR